MGLWGRDTQWQSDGRLPDVPPEPLQLDEIERVAVGRSLNLLQARQRVLATGQQLGFNRSAAWLPELDFGIHGEREEGSWQIGPDIALPIPLFDQGQARIGRAAAELRRAHNDYYALAVEVRSSARALRDRVEAARERALYYRDILLPLRERIVNEVQLQYNAMQLGPFQLLQAREQQVEAAVTYVDTLREYWLARGDAEQLLSGRLPSSAASVSRAMQLPARTNDSERH
jgi:cobalt-zinc-cadmium efflux system outer membrane protein